MNIKKILLDALEETFLHLNYELADLTLTFSNRPAESDFQCNSAFAIAISFSSIKLIYIFASSLLLEFSGMHMASTK